VGAGVGATAVVVGASEGADVGTSVGGSVGAAAVVVGAGVGASVVVDAGAGVGDGVDADTGSVTELSPPHQVFVAQALQ